MSGCDWQNKSFSVAMRENDKTICEECKEVIDSAVYSYNGENLCRECFLKKPSLSKNKKIGSFNTSKDLLWDFDYWDGPKKLHFSSKGQFDRYCKQKGLSWRDVKQGNRTEKDFLKNSYDHPTPRKEIAKIMIDDMREKRRVRIN